LSEEQAKQPACLGFIWRQPRFLAFGILVLTFILPQCAFAAAGGGALPWDTSLTTLETDLTGPTAFTLAMLAIFVAGVALVFGGELSHFVRAMVFSVMVAALLVGIANVAAALGIAGAVVQ
jgi:type IV secretory pathway VirB2 component (pilin)